MSKIFFPIWTILGSVFMGVSVLLVLLVPALSSNEMSMVLPAAIFGAVVALPFSYLLSKHIYTKFK